MDFFVNYWFVIFGILVFFAMCVYFTYNFINMPTEKQKEALREWLKYGVSVAENELGGGTGQLKLRMVYDMTIEKFSWVSKIYTFDDFSKDVDIALKWLDEQLSKNKNIKAVIAGEEN